MRALILAGGDLTVTPLLRRLSQANFIVAADSGLRHALTLGFTPDLIVGDFDSASPTDLRAFAAVPVRRFDTRKNQLDLELAIEAALDKGATTLRLFGALGSRLDQSLAALFIAARLAQGGVEISLHGANQDIFLLAGEDRLELELLPKQIFSLLSLSEASNVSVTNAEYNLDDFELKYGVGLGVSNRVSVSPLKVRTTRGVLALVVERGEG